MFNTSRLVRMTIARMSDGVHPSMRRLLEAAVARRVIHDADAHGSIAEVARKLHQSDQTLSRDTGDACLHISLLMTRSIPTATRQHRTFSFAPMSKSVSLASLHGPALAAQHRGGARYGPSRAQRRTLYQSSGGHVLRPGRYRLYANSRRARLPVTR